MPRTDEGAAPPSVADLALPGTPDDLAKIRERVLNVVGHELITPATTLRGLADAVADGDAATRDRLTPLLQRNARRLEGLVNDLLLAAGVATVLPVGEPDAVKVAPAVAEQWGAPAENGLVLEVDEDLTAHVHEAAFRRVLDHVLCNAKVYGDRPVTVSARRRTGDVDIAVDSPGRPLHPEEIRLAAEPFFRGEHAVMTAPGLGLGLAVARVLVEHAGGQLSIAGRQGGGLVTRVVLPAGDLESS